MYKNLNTFDDEYKERYKQLEFDREYYKELPEEIKNILIQYVFNNHSLPTFLEGICCNDLGKTVGYCSEDNLKFIKKLYQWFYNVCPLTHRVVENYRNKIKG